MLSGQPGAPAPLLRLGAFEGPLDLLLELARAQKVDLAQISILRLVEQYLAAIDNERQLRLELAADWLVMAAWLTWLKSRLLLPREEAGADEPEDAGAAATLLTARLAELAHVERAAGWLGARHRLGHEVFARGSAEDLTEIDRSGLKLEMPHLLGAYMAVLRRAARKRVWRPKPLAFWSVRDALLRLRLLLGEEQAEWRALERFLPDWLAGAGAVKAEPRRAAVAGTLVAGLELARCGVVELAQQEPFGAILLRRAASEMREAAE